MENALCPVRRFVLLGNLFDYSLLEMKVKVWHIVPVNDIEPHFEESFQIQDKADPIEYFIGCLCKCEPKICPEKDGAVLIIHNSFDGREGLEWMNEILNDK